MARQLGAALLAALTIGALGGCAGSTPETSTGENGATPAPNAASSSAPPAASGPPWYEGVGPAEAAGRVGAAGTPCELPVSFSLAAKWQAEAVDATGELAALARLGGATARCEIDAKPAGNIGFLRVWTVDKAGTGARDALTAFLAESGTITEPQYRDTKAGPLDAVEVSYLNTNELTGEKREQALAVVTPAGTVLITLSGLDTDEFEEMLPAYQLARQSVAATS